jgi:hypothetical protein
MPELHVRKVVGRYGRGALHSENIQASVSLIAHVFRIRLDDSMCPDAWFEIDVELDTHEAPCTENDASP